MPYRVHIPGAHALAHLKVGFRRNVSVGWSTACKPGPDLVWHKLWRRFGRSTRRLTGFELFLGEKSSLQKQFDKRLEPAPVVAHSQVFCRWDQFALKP